MRNYEMSSLRVCDVHRLIVEHPATVRENTPIEEALRAMHDNPSSCRAFVVDDEGVLLGAIEARAAVDLLFPFASLFADDADLLIGRVPELGGSRACDVMERDVASVSVNAPLSEAANLLVREGKADLPVVDDQGRLVGDISLREIIESFLVLILPRNGSGDSSQSVA